MYIQNIIKKIDKKAYEIMKNGIKISFVFCLIASFILVTYNSIGNPNIFRIGISLFKSSLYYIVWCIVCGFVFSKIKNDGI